MKWVLIIVVMLVALVAAIIGIGALLPQSHTATRSIRTNASGDTVWSVLMDRATFPQWRDDVKTVEILDSPPGAKRWRETGSNGTIEYEMTDVTPDRSFTNRIVSKELPFGGAWTYVLVPEGNGTRVTITENGEVYSPLFRFVSRFIMGHTTTLDTFLRSLGKKFGDTVEPETPGAE